MFKHELNMLVIKTTKGLACEVSWWWSRADAVRLLVLSWSFAYYFVRNLLILYYVIVTIFIDGIEKNVTNKKRRSIKNKEEKKKSKQYTNICTYFLWEKPNKIFKVIVMCTCRCIVPCLPKFDHTRRYPIYYMRGYQPVFEITQM